MRTWWVNQGKTFEQEVRGGYMWSPKVQSDGTRLTAYDNMLELSIGDAVFSYFRKAVRAVGVVVGSAISSGEPREFNGRWLDTDGWKVEVDFLVSNSPVSPKDYWSKLALLMPSGIRPLDKNGDGNQKTYLSEINSELGNFLSIKMGLDPQDLFGEESELFTSEYFEEAEIWQDASLTETERERIVLSRLGQGKFRTRVFNFEKTCRVTGVADPKMLIASHIKPWRNANPIERLDGNNGLMLSPHIDHLFDQGFISFGDKGSLLISTRLTDDVCHKWNLGSNLNVGKFTTLQQGYLAYHRDLIFQR